MPGLVMAGHFVLYIPQWWALPVEKKKKKTIGISNYHSYWTSTFGLH
jgi:hypothetical protein